MTTRTEALDEALERLTGYAYQDGPGLACHGPMGAEALSSLGHDALVGGWVEAYKTNHPPIAAPPALRRIDPGDETSWRAALGDFTRVTDWHALFIHELDERPWRPCYAPGCRGCCPATAVV